MTYIINEAPDSPFSRWKINIHVEPHVWSQQNHSVVLEPFLFRVLRHQAPNQPHGPVRPKDVPVGNKNNQTLLTCTAMGIAEPTVLAAPGGSHGEE